MLKTIKRGAVLSLYVGVISLGSCSKGKVASPMNCASDSEKVGAAATTYAKNPTKANCEAYKKTVSDFYKSCATFYTGASKKALDDFMAEPCPN